MSKLVQRIVALVVMLAVVMSATAYGASTFVVDYQELKSDAPVVMTVNGEEIHADEYASYMMSQIINYQQMYAMYGLSEKNMASTFGDAAKESAKQQVALIHIVKQKMDELGLSLSYSQKKNIVTANKQNAEQLGGEERRIFLLHAVAGFKHREIAEFMELPLATVLSKYSRAVKKMRKYLEEAELYD